MKRLFFNYLVIAALVVATAFTSCKKDKEDDKSKMPEYITLTKDLLVDQFDFAILGRNGAGYFYEFQDEDAIPQRLTIYNGKKDEVELVVNFDEYGSQLEQIAEVLRK